MRGLLLFVFIFIFFSQIEQLYSQEKYGITKVVIDAGHGGKDPGAIGKRSQEKKITLAIALKLGKMIRDNYPDVKVLYTREKDVFVELHERAGIANRNKADLFISIHCNANRSKVHHGAETYVMGLHKTEANLSIAKMENASILMEPDYQVNYEGFDPNSDESYITFTLFQNIYLEHSTSFASIIQENLTERSKTTDRGVRQAGFMVLYKTTMPSVLVEAGFLSNSEEEAFLASDKGQEYVANAVYKAFRIFKSKMDGNGEDAKKFSDVEAPLKEPVKVTVPPEKKDTGKAVAPPEKKSVPAVCYRIQFAMYPKEIPLSSKKFASLSNVKMYKHQGMFKYTTGEEQDLQNALIFLEEVKKKGYNDAFVVAFKGNTRITIAEAKKLQAMK